MTSDDECCMNCYGPCQAPRPADATHWRACDKPGCDYVAEGRTARETVARMARHWTSEDHKDHVLSILAEG